MLPYPATRFAKKLSNLCGAKQQLAGVKFSSAGADANKGFLVMGLFTGHMLPSFQNLTAPIMLIARARTDKSNATSSLLMRFTPFLQIGQIKMAGCDVHVVRVAKNSFVFYVLERNFRRNLDVGADFQVNLMCRLGNSGIPKTGYAFIVHMFLSFHKSFKHSSRKASRPLGVTRVWMPLQLVFSL
uniref:Uncharacterized protein n=1 Tax=Siphoviridae sp. ctM6i4 TaxID=2827852 RepID=A0A8S5T4B3_9CAUD|nr:MAG TPA: hypothetical protein [Siphoviridae sp. ctM6i4]